MEKCENLEVSCIVLHFVHLPFQMIIEKQTVTHNWQYCISAKSTLFITMTLPISISGTGGKWVKTIISIMNCLSLTMKTYLRSIVRYISVASSYAWKGLYLKHYKRCGVSGICGRASVTRGGTQCILVFVKYHVCLFWRYSRTPLIQSLLWVATSILGSEKLVTTSNIYLVFMFFHWMATSFIWPF